MSYLEEKSQRQITRELGISRHTVARALAAQELPTYSLVKKVYFTGMLTHGQSDFFIQYIDPESHTIRSYYPDFLLQKEDGQYFIIEVKADNQIDALVVLAKRDYAEKMAAASNMTYFLLKASDAQKGHYKMMWSKESRDTYINTINQPTIGLLGV
jgi:hypothetical protein